MFPQSLSKLIELRKNEHDNFHKIVPPDTIHVTYGDYFLTHHTFNIPSSGEILPTMSNEPTAALLLGTSACAGVATGRAMVLAHAAEGDRLSHGDILVTRQTDPGWASVFFMVRGLVIERGGMLSHGAIIAREYGIPAVVGVSKATALIRSGQIVCVDGNVGSIGIKQ
jgi:pyruvate,water dikinase